jgi:hypothetical protein
MEINLLDTIVAAATWPGPLAQMVLTIARAGVALGASM